MAAAISFLFMAIARRTSSPGKRSSCMSRSLLPDSVRLPILRPRLTIPPARQIAACAAKICRNRGKWLRVLQRRGGAERGSMACSYIPFNVRNSGNGECYPAMQYPEITGKIAANSHGLYRCCAMPKPVIGQERIRRFFRYRRNPGPYKVVNTDANNAKLTKLYGCGMFLKHRCSYRNLRVRLMA